MASDHVKKLPVFWGHGKIDPLVRYEWGVQSVDFLVDSLGISKRSSEDGGGAPVGLTFNSYEGLQHSANEKELSDLQSWLKRVIPEDV